MFVTTAFAQDAAAAAPADGTTALLLNILPIVLLVVIFWLLIFRPQQKRLKEQRSMLEAVRRGDTIVSTGGIIGKVTKSEAGQDLEVEIAPGVKVKMLRTMISDVRTKSEPVNDNKPA